MFSFAFLRLFISSATSLYHPSPVSFIACWEPGRTTTLSRLPQSSIYPAFPFAPKHTLDPFPHFIKWVVCNYPWTQIKRDMWNPPTPAVQLNIALNSTSRRDVAPSSHSNNSNRDLTSPKNSLSQDRAYNPDRHSDHGGNGHIHNSSSGPHLIPAMNRPTVSTLPHPRLQKIWPYLTIATLQAYTVLTVVRCIADPQWVVLKYDDKNEPLVTLSIGKLEKSFLACAIASTMASCLGVTLRILDKFPRFRKISVMVAYLEGKGKHLCFFYAPIFYSIAVQPPPCLPTLCAPFVLHTWVGLASFLDNAAKP